MRRRWGIFVAIAVVAFAVWTRVHFLENQFDRMRDDNRTEQAQTRRALDIASAALAASEAAAARSDAALAAADEAAAVAQYTALLLTAQLEALGETPVARVAPTGSPTVAPSTPPPVPTCTLNRAGRCKGH